MYEYFTENNYLNKTQYGFRKFRKFHSTEHAILEITERILSEFDKGNAALAIFLDLTKAFDTLNHNILLTKLNYYGIQNSTLNWFQSYLSIRQHYVEINQCKIKHSDFELRCSTRNYSRTTLFLSSMLMISYHLLTYLASYPMPMILIYLPP